MMVPGQAGGATSPSGSRSRGSRAPRPAGNRLLSLTASRLALSSRASTVMAEGGKRAHITQMITNAWKTDVRRVDTVIFFTNSLLFPGGRPSPTLLEAACADARVAWSAAAGRRCRQLRSEPCETTFPLPLKRGSAVRLCMEMRFARCATAGQPALNKPGSGCLRLTQRLIYYTISCQAKVTKVWQGG